MSKLCAECKYFEIRDVPDGMNEGHAVCKKYGLITDLIGRDYVKEIKELTCHVDGTESKQEQQGLSEGEAMTIEQMIKRLEFFTDKYVRAAKSMTEDIQKVIEMVKETKDDRER